MTVITHFIEQPLGLPDSTTTSDLCFRPYTTHTPEIRPYSSKILTKILVKKIHNLVDSSTFVFTDGSARQCGRDNGVVLKHFMLKSGEYVTKVYFRQSNSELLGIQFETNLENIGNYLLLEHHGWQVKDLLVVHGKQLNWVYSATNGHKIIGYNVMEEVGLTGHAPGEALCSALVVFRVHLTYL
jgi:hypothetical protein